MLYKSTNKLSVWRRKFLFTLFFASMLSACGEVEPIDPNAPVYEKSWVPVTGREDANVELARIICEPRAEVAELNAERAAEARYSTLETSCDSDYTGTISCTSERVVRGGFSAGYSIAGAGNRAYRAMLAACMGEQGLVYRDVCVRNCGLNE